MIAARETCQVCWHENPVGFVVPNWVWTSAVPEPLRRSVLCITCFARLADAHLVPWDDEIQLWPVSLATHLRFGRPLDKAR